MQTRRARTLAALLLAALLAPGTGRAGESELIDEPAPASTAAIEGPLQTAFGRIGMGEPLFPRLSKWLRSSDLPPFLADTQLALHLRSYFRDDEPLGGSRAEAWALGGWLHYRSGWLADHFGAEVKVFTSQKLVGPESRDGTGLLAPGQEGYTVLGVASGILHWGPVDLVGGRQEISAPYLNGNDTRMTPNTFEAVSVRGQLSSLKFGGGYVWSIKPRTAEDFHSMSSALGVTQDRGVAVLGLRWQPREDWYAGFVDQMGIDLFNTLYAESGWSRDWPHGIGSRVDLQFTQQRSVGQELIPGGAFDTWNAAGRLSASWQGAVVRLGFVATGDGDAILSPWGSNPSYVNLMQVTFNRSNEKALLASLSWDFSRLPLHGLSAILNFVQGWDAQQNDGTRIPDTRELDATLDYRVSKGRFRGFWLRLRGSWLWEQGRSGDGTDFRVILNYDLPAL